MKIIKVWDLCPCSDNGKVRLIKVRIIEVVLYCNYASVQLESAIAPSIVSQALGVVFSGIMTDGDNKTFEVQKKANLYEDLNVEITVTVTVGP